MKKNIYVITGGPGFGKTELIRHLKETGYRTGAEVAREIIEEQLKKQEDLLPGKSPRAFQSAVLQQRIDFYNSVPDSEIAFSDRGIPDQLAFARYNGFGTPDILVQASKSYKYNKLVFMLPPWKEIYTNDHIRKETFEEACKLHQIIQEMYTELGYTLIDVPFGNCDVRAEFILTNISKTDTIL